MAFTKNNKLRRFTGMKHKPESNKKRSETIKLMYKNGTALEGMGFKTIYKTKKQKSRANRNRQIKHRYGITLDEWEKIKSNQNHSCAICKLKVKRLVIDHCHKTLQVRGLLCSQCNTMLGMAKDTTEMLNSAIKYLEKYETIKDKLEG